MKASFIFLILLNGFFSFSQENELNNSSDLPTDRLYILDKFQKYRDPKKILMDESDCYLQILNGYAVISYMMRGKNYFASGKIHNAEMDVVDGDSILTFTINTDNEFASSTAGNRVFIGIDFAAAPYTNQVYLMNNRKQINYILISHLATDTERKNLEKRSEEQSTYREIIMVK